MAPIQAPVHAVRLVVAAAAVGLLALTLIGSYHGGRVLGFGLLITLGVLGWLAGQPAQRPVLDGWLTGLILGLGLGLQIGYGAYQVSDFCFGLRCEKEAADFWIWFLPIFVGQMLLGLAVGSTATGKDKPIPGMEDLPPVKRQAPSTPLPRLPDEEASSPPRAGQR